MTGRAPSMTRRLMWSLTGVTVLFWIAASVLGAYVMQDEFGEVFDSALQETAQRLMPLIVDDLFQRDITGESWRVYGGNGKDEEYITYQVRDASGAILAHSHDARTTPFEAPLKRGFSDTQEYRIYTEEAVSGTLFLQVADLYDHRREAVVEGVTSLMLPIALLAPLSMIIIFYFVRRSFAPLGSIRDEIGARNGGNLAPMTVRGLPTELETIGFSVNRLLERLRTALEAERSFASNSAHELRTPVAGALAQTQRLIAELPPGPEHDRAAGIEASLAALSHLIEKLLQLARADAGIGSGGEVVDVLAIVRLVIEDFRMTGPDAGRLQCDLREFADGVPLMRKIDMDALGIILRNLIENALVHGSPGAKVMIAPGRDGRIRVTNEGPYVPADQLATLKTRFRRGDSSAAGSGLGLSIADVLARQMNATLDLRSPATGRHDGFEATIFLPRAEPEDDKIVD